METTTCKTRDLKPGDLIDLGFAVQPVRRVSPPVGLTTYWIIETGDSADHHGSSQGCSGDKEWTVTGRVIPRNIRRTPSALERALTF